MYTHQPGFWKIADGGSDDEAELLVLDKIGLKKLLFLDTCVEY